MIAILLRGPHHGHVLELAENCGYLALLGGGYARVGEAEDWSWRRVRVFEWLPATAG